MEITQIVVPESIRQYDPQISKSIVDLSETSLADGSSVVTDLRSIDISDRILDAHTQS